MLEKERRKQSPNQEIPNQPKDIAELLQQLYKMDKALAELIGTNQDLKLAESERKMREFEELLQRDKIQALTQIVSDISDKYIQLQGEKANILDSKKEYEALCKPKVVFMVQDFLIRLKFGVKVKIKK